MFFNFLGATSLVLLLPSRPAVRYIFFVCCQAEPAEAKQKRMPLPSGLYLGLSFFRRFLKLHKISLKKTKMLQKSCFLSFVKVQDFDKDVLILKLANQMQSAKS